MGRNRTLIFVLEPEARTLWEFSSIKRAHRLMATLDQCAYWRERYTPSGKEGARKREMKRVRFLRFLRRRDADNRKMEERIKRCEAAERVADVMERFWKVIR